MTEQAHSEVFYGVGAIQLGDRPNKADGAYLLAGGGSFGKLWLSETELPSKFATAGGSPGTR